MIRRSLLAEGLVLCGSGAVAAILLAIPMVNVLGRYAARFSVRANDLTLDFSLVWFGIALALVAAVFLAYIPRLPSPNGTQGGLSARSVARGGWKQQPEIANLRRYPNHCIVPAAGRGVRSDENSVCARADPAAV